MVPRKSVIRTTVATLQSLNRYQVPWLQDGFRAVLFALAGGQEAEGGGGATGADTQYGVVFLTRNHWRTAGRGAVNIDGCS